MARTRKTKTVETLKHDEATRRNIPTAEYQSVMQEEDLTPIQVAYEGRNVDLDPQLVWRGKDLVDWSDLVVPAPPLYIQEKVHPKVLVDDLLRQTKVSEAQAPGQTFDLFADFNGLASDADRTDFYQHDQNWSNRMILGDSLQVMASLAEREGLRGKVQCIYFDPPYGIKFNSNFQWSTTSRDVKDGKADHITREPEQVKAFRDTWRDGVHSYLTYLRDRLVVAHDLLASSGSLFVQIGDENVHRVRTVLDEVFGEDNFVSMISVAKTSSSSGNLLSSVNDYILWYAKSKPVVKYRQPYFEKSVGGVGGGQYTWAEDGTGARKSYGRSKIEDAAASGHRVLRPDNITSQRPAGDGDVKEFRFRGRTYSPGKGTFKSDLRGLSLLARANRLIGIGKTLCYARYLDDFPVFPLSNTWDDTGISGFGDPKVYVVQTLSKVVSRCVLMSTDPGDLVLDPTCGSGTTAAVAEQWGRRWITVDTSRVALALARARVMAARYPYYLLADSREGQLKDAELSRKVAPSKPVHGDVRHGFVYERVPHITLKSIANNTEIDVIWGKWQDELAPLLQALNAALDENWHEWDVPRNPESDWSSDAQRLLQEWHKARIARQRDIDASIASKADFEFLYDKPYTDHGRVRVAGPFTVESLSPHRVLGVDENDELIDPRVQRVSDTRRSYGEDQTFAQMILENLRTAGVQQAHKADRIAFTALAPWPGELVCAEGRYFEGGEDKGTQRRAAVFIGPEFGTVSRPDLVQAAREAADADFDVLIACAFNFEAQTTEFNKLGRIPVLKARMNADLHMGDDLKNTGKGNLFVIFGEPDIDILPQPNDQMCVKVNGVDVFKPNLGKVEASSVNEIACWFIDTDYNEESFFVRHAYFLGQNDPYRALKTTLKAEINEEAWSSLRSDTSRPFDKPKSGRIAVKVINHLGDEVMKVFRV